MMQDFRFAVRQLLKTPGFTTVAVLTLAMAIGVNSASFALINGVVLKPVVPVRPNEVVNVFTARQNASHDYRQFSYNEYRELRDNGRDIFVDVSALEFAVAGIGRDHEMRRSFAFLTSENYFSLMGVQPFRGRFYNAEECKPNANMAVVVASYGFWKRYGGRNDFVGSTLHINRQPYTVIGIAPDGFSGERADRARHLGAARSSFGARFRLWRFPNDARPVEPEALHVQSHDAAASGPDDRRG
jgi:putative ABC transport system permease protein